MAASEAELAALVRQVRDNPRSIAFVALAEALRRAGRPHDALATLREGERHRPDFGPARVVLARTHLDLGHRAMAIEVLSEVARSDAENVAGVALLARLLSEDGRFAEADQLLQRLRMTGGAEAELADILTRQSEELQRVPQTEDPFDAPTVADALAERGALDAAVRIWRRLALVDPRHPVVRQRIEELEARRVAASAEADIADAPRPARASAAAAVRRYAHRVFPGAIPG